MYQVSEELVVVGVSFSDALHLDGLLVLDVEDDVAVGLALLDVLERLLALGSHCDTRRLEFFLAKRVSQIDKLGLTKQRHTFGRKSSN